MTLSPVKRFWQLLSLYKEQIRQIYIYALFIGIINLTLPLGIQAIINFLQTGELTSTWLILVGLVLAGIGLSGALQVVQLRIVENIQKDLFARSSLEFAYRLPRIYFLQLDRIHAPELANRFFDTLTIQKGLPKILIDFSLAVFQIAFGLTVLAIYSPYFIILGATLLLILWVMFQITAPRGLSTSLKESKYKYSLVHWLEEVARVNRTFKMVSKDQFHVKKADEITKGYLSSREKHFQVLISQFQLFIVFKVLVAAGLLLLGGYLVYQEQMNIGQFVAAEIIILLIINSIEKVLSTIDTIYDVLTALDKIGYVTDLQLDKVGGAITVDTNKRGLALEAKEITFGFPDDKKKVFNNFSFDLAANDNVVLTGKSGSGKSVLLQVLAGLHDVEDGELYIDDVPYNNYNRDDLHDKIGVGFNVNQIFEGTFRENILLGRDISVKRLSEVLEIVGLERYLRHQLDGLEGMIDSGGRRLPRSIIQKILVARIIIHEPKLLLLEDPLLFVEEEEKRRIIEYIMDKKRGWTVLVVADSDYWKEKADRVIEIGNN